MEFTQELLIEIEDCINYLDRDVGLKPETMQDIQKAIAEQKRRLSNLSKPPNT